MKRLICVCLGNTCRSPMIEALVRKALQEKNIQDVNVQSAGLLEVAKEGNDANPKSIEAMRKMGIDITYHKSQWIKDVNLDFDLVLTVGKKEALLLQELGISPESIVIVNGETGVPNPWQKNQTVYDNTRKIISDWINKEIDNLISRL